MEKVKIEDSKLASYIHDELNRRAYQIIDFDVYKEDTGFNEHCAFVFGIDENTYIDVIVEDRSSVSEGNIHTKLCYSYKLKHDCDNFPTMMKLRKDDQLVVIDDPSDDESPLKIRLYRWGGHIDNVEHKVDRGMVKNLIDEILKRLEVNEFIE